MANQDETPAENYVGVSVSAESGVWLHPHRSDQLTDYRDVSPATSEAVCSRDSATAACGHQCRSGFDQEDDRVSEEVTLGKKSCLRSLKMFHTL